MLVRGFEALSLAVNGGSAFTKNGRPASSTTLAIWPLAPRAKTVAQRTSVARRSPAVIAVRFFIILPWERQQQFCSLLQSAQFSTWPRSGQCPFSTRAPPPSGLPRGKTTPGDSSLCEVVLAGMPNWLRPWNENVSPGHASGATGIIARVRSGRGHSPRPLLGQLCLFRQLRPGQVFPHRNPLAVWPVPVSACQHGL